MIKKIIIAILSVTLLIITIIGYHVFFTPKLGYIDVPMVFNGFEMKNEMEKKYKQTETLRKAGMDSLTLELQVLANRLKTDNKNQELISLFDAKRQFYYSKKEQNEEDNAALSSQYDQQILEQMSTYIIEYGKKYNYDFIYGSSGNGTLMFANEKYNISKEIIQFINDKYQGLE